MISSLNNEKSSQDLNEVEKTRAILFEAQKAMEKGL